MKREERSKKFAGVWLSAVVLLMVFSARAAAADFFSDSFAGPDLDPRWTTDNSPSNIANDPDSTIKILAGMAVGQPTYSDAYNHIETPIDASINFVVQADVRNNYGNSWGPAVVVYWSPSVFVSLKAPAGEGTYFTSFISDGVNYTSTASSVLSGGWDMATLRIEFESDTIKFYAKNSVDPSAIHHLSGLDIPRAGVFKNSAALLIVGKGYQSADYTSPDYDNDYASVGGLDSVMIDNVIYHPLSPVPRNYFTDTFDGPALDARWKRHNSPVNVNEPDFAGGSEIAIVNGAAQAYPTYDNCYNHIETDIDASIDFAVQADIRNDHGASWGPALVVYWDSKTFVSIKAAVGGAFCTFVGDGSQMAVKNSFKLYGGWDLATVRIEFLSDTIQFFAKSELDPELYHLPTLDVPRTAAFKKPYAVMVVGKGYQGFGAGYEAYMNPDYNNDYTGGPGTSTYPDVLIIDNALYEPLGMYECGDPGTQYLDSDMNEDCQVNLEDMAIFAQQWQWCSNPQDPNCDQYWLYNAYFADDFDYISEPTPLDPRWTSDNSSGNPAGTDLTIVNWRDGVAQSEGKRNLYNHLETPIDASVNFSVESLMMGKAPSSWAPSLMVYWDTTHWIRFAQFDYYGLMYNDGVSEHNIPSYMLCGGWDFFRQRIVFEADTIKFYATTPGFGDELFPISAFDIPRGAWSKAAGAKLIVGKGYQGWGYNKSDFDNDYVEPENADYLGIDYISYQPFNVNSCQDLGAVYFASDLNTDCQVNMDDLVAFVAQWLQCTDPADSACDPYWNP